MRFRLIAAEKTQHRISLLCSVLGVSRAGYYAWKRRSPSRRAVADDRLARLIARVFKESHETYGSPRIQAELADEHGWGVGRKRVARLMRELGLAGVSRRRKGIKTNREGEGGARCGRSRAAPVPRPRPRSPLGGRYHLRLELGGLVGCQN